MELLIIVGLLMFAGVVGFGIIQDYWGDVFKFGDQYGSFGMVGVIEQEVE